MSFATKNYARPLTKTRSRLNTGFSSGSRSETLGSCSPASGCRPPQPLQALQITPVLRASCFSFGPALRRALNLGRVDCEPELKSRSGHRRRLHSDELSRYDHRHQPAEPWMLFDPDGVHPRLLRKGAKLGGRIRPAHR